MTEGRESFQPKTEEGIEAQLKKIKVDRDNRQFMGPVEIKEISDKKDLPIESTTWKDLSTKPGAEHRILIGNAVRQVYDGTDGQIYSELQYNPTKITFYVLRKEQ
jgi:hypothetical protein